MQKRQSKQVDSKYFGNPNIEKPFREHGLDKYNLTSIQLRNAISLG